MTPRSDSFILGGQRFDVRAPRRAALEQATKDWPRATSEVGDFEHMLDVIELCLANDDARRRWRELREDTETPVLPGAFIAVAEWLIRKFAPTREVARAPEEFRMRLRTRLAGHRAGGRLPASTCHWLRRTGTPRRRVARRVRTSRQARAPGRKSGQKSADDPHHRVARHDHGLVTVLEERA
jgi:hypothetical protein